VVGVVPEDADAASSLKIETRKILRTWGITYNSESIFTNFVMKL
jgi:hypothetical protein